MPIINITIDTDRGGTLAQALQALGLPHVVSNLPDDRDLAPKDFPYTDANGHYDPSVDLTPSAMTRTELQADLDKGMRSPSMAGNYSQATTCTLNAMDGDRKRGEPGAGHRRRTNKEIEEDKLYFDSLKVPGHAAVAAMEQGVESQSQGRYEITGQSGVEAVESALGIPSGEKRLSPEDDAQDAADEAAESAKNRGAEPTLDDLRQAVGFYQKKFGMAQASTRIKEMLGMPLLEVPSKDIGVMIHRVMAAVEHDKKEDAKFTPIQTQSGIVQQATIATPKTATRDEVNAALNDYATRYDGSLDPAKMPVTREDVPRILERLFGAGKKSFNDFDKSLENLGRVLAAVRAETEKNTFGRTPK